MDQVDFIVGTFSKSLGAMGGFCASPPRGTGTGPLRFAPIYIHGFLQSVHHRQHARSAAADHSPAGTA